MVLTSSQQQAMVIFVGAICVFLLLKKSDDGRARMEMLPVRKRQQLQKPTLSPEALKNDTLRQAYLCLCKYIDSYNDGMSQSELEKIKNKFKEDAGFDIYQDANMNYCVKDIQGINILYYN